VSKPLCVDVWRRLRPGLAKAPTPGPTGVAVPVYLDVAERIVRAAVPWQDRCGVIVDPYLRYHASTCTPRFVGALGQLIGAGRCEDLVDACVRSYEYALATLNEPAVSPEFSVKELVFAYHALRDKVAADRLARWEAHWRDYDAASAFGCVRRDQDSNFNTFGLVGEFARIRAGLGGSMDLVERLLEGELRRVDDNGMYEDPNGPLTYHVVVLQQWALLLSLGYAGEHAEAVAHIVRRGGIASLLMQSVVGQSPFGGRSNQFHHNEAQAAGLFEACARLAMDDGDPVLAGAFKRSARRGVAMILPWIMQMEPYRHLKQGFHPGLDHGTDSSGVYSVYGLLIASLLGMAARLADETILERSTPAESGGYVFATGGNFHQVFASCGGWSVQIDTRAVPGKDATGLGRVQRVGLRPEAILAGSIPAEPAYSFAYDLPQRSLAIGPQWESETGAVHRLADLSEEIADVRVSVTEERPERVAFEIAYTGDLGGARSVREFYELDAGGLRYRADVAPRPKALAYAVPVIETDGDQASQVAPTAEGLRVSYRGGVFRLGVMGGTLALTDERDSNRNATYRAALALPSTSSPMTLSISQDTSDA